MAVPAAIMACVAAQRNLFSPRALFDVPALLYSLRIRMPNAQPIDVMTRLSNTQENVAVAGAAARKPPHIGFAGSDHFQKTLKAPVERNDLAGQCARRAKLPHGRQRLE